MGIKTRVRTQLAKNEVARSAHRRAIGLKRVIDERISSVVSFQKVPAAVAIHLAYQVMLRREPDENGYQQLSKRLAAKTLDRNGMVEEIRGSEEYQTHIRFGGDRLGHSIHVGRQLFIRSLPKAQVIVDLGGGHKTNDEGALVALGYPYEFEHLTIIDLPTDARHELYQTERLPTSVQTHRGLVTYQYRSMAQLEDHLSGGTDLVYSGQSIEHVDAMTGRHVAREVFRMLRPGGFFALDTPNGRITRVQQEEFIDPDHEIEYTSAELLELLDDAGFSVVFAKGLNYAGDAVKTGIFDFGVVAGNSGLYDEIQDCYISCVIAQKPFAVSAGPV